MGKGYGFLLQIIDKNEFLIEESRYNSTATKSNKTIRFWRRCISNKIKRKVTPKEETRDFCIRERIVGSEISQTLHRLIGFKYAFLFNEFYGIRSGILIRNRSRCGIEPSDGINLFALRWRLRVAIFFFSRIFIELWPCFDRIIVNAMFEIIFQRLLSTLKRIQSEKNIDNLKKNHRRKGGVSRIFL